MLVIYLFIFLIFPKISSQAAQPMTETAGASIIAYPPLEKVNIIKTDKSIPGVSKAARVNNSLEVMQFVLRNT